jgi:hypothetical protein
MTGAQYEVTDGVPPEVVITPEIAAVINKLIHYRQMYLYHERMFHNHIDIRFRVDDID